MCAATIQRTLGNQLLSRGGPVACAGGHARVVLRVCCRNGNVPFRNVDPCHLGPHARQ